MIYLVVFISFLSCYLLFSVVLGVIIKKRQQVNIRLENIAKEGQKSQDVELNQPLFVRVVRPFLDDLSKFVLKVTPRELVRVYEKKVMMAGTPLNIPVKDWINILVIIVVGLPILTAILGYSMKLDPGQIFLLCICEAAGGILIPSFFLNKNIKQRQKQMINALPDVLDLLTVSVEAGLGFDGALAKVIDKVPGALSAEFATVLQEVKVGKTKKDALRDMSNRVAVPDVTTFIGSIIQAEQLGVSIGNVLRIQSEQLRQKRRQRAQEKAMKAPVKILIPMVLFIFPTIFSVLIGPVVIQMLRNFMK